MEPRPVDVPPDPFDRLLEHLPVDLPVAPPLRWRPAPGAAGHLQAAHSRTPAEPGQTVFLSWFVRGPLGGAQFEAMAIAGEEEGTLFGVEVGFHSPRPTADGRPDEAGECPVLPTRCWYGGSTESGASLGELLVEARLDEECVWRALGRVYEGHADSGWVGEPGRG